MMMRFMESFLMLHQRSFEERNILRLWCLWFWNDHVGNDGGQETLLASKSWYLPYHRHLQKHPSRNRHRCTRTCRLLQECWHSDPNQRPSSIDLNTGIEHIKNLELENVYCKKNLTKIVKSPNIGPITMNNRDAVDL